MFLLLREVFPSLDGSDLLDQQAASSFLYRLRFLGPEWERGGQHVCVPLDQEQQPER